MNIIEIIEKKRDGQILTKEEIEYFVKAYCDGTIAEYQASALLMAIYFNSLNKEELSVFTKAMIESGRTYDFSSYDGVFVDKHSTGGVGDKTTLVLAPILAVCGCKVAKMSGRGLSFTGGTLDKLESIPGLQVEVSEADFMKQVEEIGCAVIGQSNDMVYADKKLYALRDVTGTVSSIPLIASSVMSKKIAAGSEVILLDVKCGDGAFMKNKDDAIELAKRMIEIGESANRKVAAEITSMDDVLGTCVGNSLEVWEAIETLKGNYDQDFYDLCVHSSYTILKMANICENEEEARQKVEACIQDGTALAKLKEMIEYQHGNGEVVNNYELLAISKQTVDVYADTAGYLNTLHVKDIGLLSCALGAGRMQIEDAIDHGVGIVLHKKRYDRVEKGDILCTLYVNDTFEESLVDKMKACFVIEENEIEREPLIYKVLH
ncbi:pyrimidine-nucleoside phosphorylase [Breznakia sp. PF5-3]|uniref:thymidine phosphorylase n=1 Tax=unclassified Breznakia TaxID=2623764 RepID=UPI002406FC99|nr:MULTISPECIES: thymidine phosphorylase [unclassified Breznakia]MDF9825657.1 pyrimidine-nucleoside phosphorylase [Breznakia sp. PM6-1]MDF9836503.1 pyrimidine-nucleoside phosphorylase [Breznakia sp. PF5-3]MDF9838648.1 pyrimidine-nucleoside phosphorylase [Breznakia sp. PFB2-8]MDF9860679.1 pyrimidine-nucleoside phosphorylase [Breznakia sp. PH5-24]